MFDEKSSTWIRWFKRYTQIVFWLYIIAGGIMFFVGCSGQFPLIDDGFLDGFICLAGGVFVAYVQLVTNMLIIQLLNNVQLIRQKLENQ